MYYQGFVSTLCAQEANFWPDFESKKRSKPWSKTMKKTMTKTMTKNDDKNDDKNVFFFSAKCLSIFVKKVLFYKTFHCRLNQYKVGKSTTFYFT